MSTFTLLILILISVVLFKDLAAQFSSYGMAVLMGIAKFQAHRFINAALHVAVRRSDPLGVEFLLRSGADCAARNSNGNTALLASFAPEEHSEDIAIQKDNDLMIQRLISTGRVIAL